MEFNPIKLGEAYHSEKARQITMETAIALLVRAMGDSVVFNHDELLDVFMKMERNELRVEMIQTQDPWQVRIKVVERE